MLTAEYGGTGGRAIEAGMIVEEPDIEIGAGVSSKGMSERYTLFLNLPLMAFGMRLYPNSAFFLIFLLPTAISRRMATDQGGKRGPQSSRGGNHGSSRNDDRLRNNDNRSDRENNDRPNSSGNGNTAAAVPPPVPGFGFAFPTMPNGMPMFPPGFVMPALPQQNYSAPDS